MTFRDETDVIFGRLDDDGNVVLLYEQDGSPVTRLDATPTVWPIGSSLGSGYDHPEGLTISREDAERLGVEIEDAMGWEG